MDEEATSTAVVLHEDKKYYPSAEEVYPGVNTATLDEDAQPLEEPILAEEGRGLADRAAGLGAAPARSASAFLRGLLGAPSLLRNVALLGPLHAGKTLLVDALLHAENGDDDAAEPPRATDTRADEQARELSIKATPGRSSRPTRAARATASTCATARATSRSPTRRPRRCASPTAPCSSSTRSTASSPRASACCARRCASTCRSCSAISKLDRLVLELKLPPEDCYRKLCHTLDDVNAAVCRALRDERGLAPDDAETQRWLLAPAKGNVCFSAAFHGWCFTLESFARAYAGRQPGGLEKHAGLAARLAPKLWGDVYLDPRTRQFVTTPPEPAPADDDDDDDGAAGEPPSPRRTFVQLVLEPLYKIYATALGEGERELASVAARLGVPLRRDELHLDPRPLVRVFMRRFLGPPSGFVDMLAKFVPSPAAAARARVTRCYSATSRRRAPRRCSRATAPRGRAAHAPRREALPAARRRPLPRARASSRARCASATACACSARRTRSPTTRT